MTMPTFTPVAWEWVEPEKGMQISHNEPPDYEVYQVAPLFSEAQNKQCYEAGRRDAAPLDAINKILTEVMDIAVGNGANSISMPDEYVTVAAWLCGITPKEAAPQVEQEPVYYEYRSLWGDDTVRPGWSEWGRVKPRDALCTIEDAVNELEEYIAAGYKYQLRRLYAAPPAPAVPDGWKLAPIEPTEEMIENALMMDGRISGHNWAQGYGAMLAASPEPTK